MRDDNSTLRPAAGRRRASRRRAGRRLRPRIYQLAFRYLRNKEDAEEVTQDVLFKVIGRSARSAATRRCRPGSTASRSTRRCRGCAPAKYQTRRRDEAGDNRRRPTASSAEPADWSDMADERVFRPQLRRRVFRAILALPAIYRAPVMLRDIQGMSTEEASAMLRVKDQTLKSRLHRGRLDPAQAARRLRRRARRCIGQPELMAECKSQEFRKLSLRSQSQIAYRVIAFSSATRSCALSARFSTSATPPDPSRTGSAAARIDALRVVRGDEAADD